MKESSKRWIEAGKILSKDSTSRITCPECEKGILVIKDLAIIQYTKKDRYIFCNKCEVWNVISMIVD